MENSLDKIFSNDKNSVTLTLGDYESIKAVYNENKSLSEANKYLQEQLATVIKVFSEAKLPGDVIKQLLEGTLKIESTSMLQNVLDPLGNSYSIVIRIPNQGR